MKEWALKHPWLTFILLYDTGVTIANVLHDLIDSNRRERTLGVEFLEGVSKGRQAAKEALASKDEEIEDRTIGFKAS